MDAYSGCRSHAYAAYDGDKRARHYCCVVYCTVIHLWTHIPQTHTAILLLTSLVLVTYIRVYMPTLSMNAYSRRSIPSSIIVAVLPQVGQTPMSE